MRNLGKNKIYIGIIVLVVILFGGFALMQKNNSKSENKSKTSNSASKKSNGSADLVTAKEAWEKVKPYAEKWSNDYKIARISEVSNPKYQRIDGQSIGWKFYLEACDEYYTSKSLANTCKSGKSQSFYYQVIDFVSRKKGVTTDSQTNMSSGRSTFDSNQFKIDSDLAQDKAREVNNRQRNENEEFKMEAVVINGTPYWEIGRQCWVGGDRSKCDSQNGYTAYVNLETGEAFADKPKGQK